MGNAAKKKEPAPATPDEVKLVTVHLPEALHRKGKSRAALLGLTWDQYLAGLVELDSTVPQLNEVTAKFAGGVQVRRFKGTAINWGAMKLLQNIGKDGKSSNPHIEETRSLIAGPTAFDYVRSDYSVLKDDMISD